MEKMRCSEGKRGTMVFGFWDGMLWKSSAENGADVRLEGGRGC